MKTLLKTLLAGLMMISCVACSNSKQDENGRNIKHKVYYAIQPYLKAKQARYVKIHQDTQNNMITFGCRAIEGDIPMFIRNMSGNWDY